LGWVPEAELPGLYREALAFVLASRYEGFWITCIEAMASGIPVVAADRAALPEACAGAALLVDPDDPRALAEAVLAAATDEPTRGRLREAGLRRAAQLPWSATAAATHQLLSELSGLSRGSGPRPGTPPAPP
ncbi:MAG: glycosyltransferase, partial [Solirubrobacteraceae bacterium]